MIAFFIDETYYDLTSMDRSFFIDRGCFNHSHHRDLPRCSVAIIATLSRRRIEHVAIRRGAGTNGMSTVRESFAARRRC
jgi:hypothetical protein